jgi:hypothetical protein
MKTLKLLAGIVLLLLAIFFTLSLLGTLLNFIPDTTNAFTRSSAEGWGYLLGSITAKVLFAVLIYYMFKFSIRLMKNQPLKKDKTAAINEIGKSDL